MMYPILTHYMKATRMGPRRWDIVPKTIKSLNAVITLLRLAHSQLLHDPRVFWRDLGGFRLEVNIRGPLPDESVLSDLPSKLMESVPCASYIDVPVEDIVNQVQYIRIQY